MSKTHFYTSCTNNYLPLARVFAKTLKQFHPDYFLHLVLCDAIHSDFDLEEEDFDNVITVEDLDIPNLQQWLFKHSVVELCTAVKGRAGQYILERYRCENVIYFDPDIAIFADLKELIANFRDGDILITPHQLAPETIPGAVVDNEIAFLRHGTFNLGFVGFNNSPNGRAFIDWWAKRCLEYCYSDTEFGLYTDQRWVDLVPSFFTGVKILRHPGYNVANWNLSNRDVRGDLASGVTVNNQPLCFYHCSGSQTIMPEKYDLYNQTTITLNDWYREQCQQMDKAQWSKLNCVYNFFENGEPIPDLARQLYRQVPELRENHPNPYSDNYYKWYLSHKTYLDSQKPENLQKALTKSQQELADALELITAMESSKFWKLRRLWFKFKTAFNPLFDLLKKIPRNPTQAQIVLYNRLKLDINPQYPPKPITLPASYYQKSELNLETLPKISLVTPSFNQGHFIEYTIKSVLEQQYPNLQYIIQDGNSQDDTPKIAKKYGATFIAESDRGQSDAINKGFARTDGEIMAWLNSDDLLLPGAFNYVAQYFAQHPEVDVIYGYRIIIDEHNQEIGRWRLANGKKGDLMLPWIDYVPQETMFWRRSIWDKVGSSLDESFQFALDWDLLLRFRAAGANIQCVPRFLGAFRVHLAQKTQAWNEVGIAEMNQLRKRCHGYVPHNEEIFIKINPYLLKCFWTSKRDLLQQIQAQKVWEISN